MFLATFAPGHPVFAGHFPGNPIVPGVLLLDEVHHALVARLACSPTTLSVSSFKFLFPVRPGQAVSWALHEHAQGLYDVQLFAGERLVASGRFMRAPPPGGALSFATPRALPVTPIDIATIRAALPHAHDMVLLGGVSSFTTERVCCFATSHRAAMPLRSHGRLGIACGLEYAAQAMALHAALRDRALLATPAAGALLAVRKLRFFVPRLDDVDLDLMVDCDVKARDQAAAVYEFMLLADGRVLMSGQATVQFAALARAEGLA